MPSRQLTTLAAPASFTCPSTRNYADTLPEATTIMTQVPAGR
jgi:hypothetical protein